MSETQATTRRRRFSVDALFTDTSPRAVGVSDLVEARLIRRERIEPDPEQPRKEFDAEALDELAASIRNEGILQPIAVRYDEPRDIYVILHGERRWRAAGIAGLDTLPAIVREVPEDRRLLQQLVENIVREDLNALDRAAALRALKLRMGDAPWERVAEAVGIRRSRLFQLLGTEKLSGSLQEALRRGIVSEKQTRPVQALPPDAQDAIGERILSGALDPRDIERAARDARSPGTGTATQLQGDHSRELRAAHRHARALSTSLQLLGDAGVSDELAAELEALRDAIDAVLAGQ